MFFKIRRYETTYGTIPFLSLRQISTLLDIKSTDTICDCGSGKGKCLLYFSIMFRCQVIAIESVSYLIKIHQCLSRLLGQQSRHRFIFDSLLTTDLPKADVYFISGLDFDNSVFAQLQRFFAACDLPIKIVCIGAPFTHLQCKKQDMVILPCSWGYCEIYIYHL